MRVAVTLELTREQSALSFSQAQALQCYSCTDPGCCTYLRVHTFWVKHVDDLTRASQLLECHGIDLGIDSRGEWSVFWSRPCRHLDQEDDSCRVHGTEVQPDVCKKYPGDDCWYQRVLPRRAHNEFVRVDRERLGWIKDRVSIDEEGRLVGFPPRTLILETFAGMPAQPRPVHDPRPEGPRIDLAFPLRVIHTAEDLDFVRMALGYPDVSIAPQPDGGWVLIVTTTGPAELSTEVALPRFDYERFVDFAAQIRAEKESSG